MELIEKTVSTDNVYSGKIIKVELDDVILPDGKNSKREIVRHGPAVAILALDDDNNVILVEQYRKPIESVILEIPAGHIEKGEDPHETALRELKEETGYEAGKIELVSKYFTSPGFTDELIYFYFAENLKKSETHFDEDEFIELKKIKADEFIRMAKDFRLIDEKAILAAFYLEAKLNK